MYSVVRNSLRWCLSLASKLTRVVFWHTALIVLLTLTSQLSMIFAFLLPLKVVILLGSEGVPVYFPDSLSLHGRDAIVLSLSLSAVAFYLTHLLSERLIGLITNRASNHILFHNKKVALFQNQDVVADNAYRRFSRVLAGSAFILISLLAISVFYPGMASVIVIFMLSASVVLRVLEGMVWSFRRLLRDQLQDVVGVVAGVGFFTSFAYLVIDFIFLTPPPVIVAILSLLLCRQVFSRFSDVVKGISSLYGQRAKIDALFFHNKILLPCKASEQKSYWPLLKYEDRAEWLDSVIASFVEDWEGCENVFWHSSSTPGIAVLIVSTESRMEKYLVKLYEPKHANHALHESTLLGAGLHGLGAPTFVGVSAVGEFTCQVYEVAPGHVPDSPKDAVPALTSIRASLLKVEPPAALADSYLRSKAVLWQRLNYSILERLKIAVSSTEQSRQVVTLLGFLPTIKSYLQSLPLVLVNPDMRPKNIWILGHAGDCALMNWSRWALEPVGSGFGVGEKDILQIGKTLRDAASFRPELRGVDIKGVELVALLTALEERCTRHQLNEALELIGPILERLETLSPEAISKKVAKGVLV